MPTRALLLTPLLLLPLACTTTKSVEHYPGLTYAPGVKTAIIEEDDHCLISTIDEQVGAMHSTKRVAFNMPLSGTTYHQYEIPAGKHTLYCFFQSKGGNWVSGNSHAVPFEVTLLPGHKYSLSIHSPTGAVRGPTVAAGFAISPFLIDDATHQVVATAPPIPD